MLHRLVPAVVALSVATGCYTTTPSRKPDDAKELEARSHTNDKPFYSEALGRRVEAGQYSFFDGLFADGEKLMDELDYYTIAGDDEKVKAIIAWREKHNFGIQMSWVAVGVGAALGVGGVTMLALNSESPETFITTPVGQGTMGALAVGGVILGSSYFAYQFVGPGSTLSNVGDYDSPGLLFSEADAAIVGSEYTSRKLREQSGTGDSTAPAPEGEPTPESN